MSTECVPKDERHAENKFTLTVARAQYLKALISAEQRSGVTYFTHARAPKRIHDKSERTKQWQSDQM